MGNEKEIKIAYIYYSLQFFVKQDRDLLSKHFEVYDFNFKSIFDILSLIKTVRKSDITYSWFAGGHAFLAVLFSKIFQKKSIVIAGGGDVASEPEIDYGFMGPYRRSRYFAKFALKYADVVLAVSEFTKKEVLKYSKPKYLDVVYNGIDTDYYKPNFKKEDMVITVGRISEDYITRKGYENFIRCAQKLQNLQFVIIGKITDDSISKLKKIAPRNVIFTGYVSDEELLEYYQKAKIYCQLSYYESFGMGLTEAMACECIPVVTNRAALPEVIGNTGLKVPYDDTDATMEAIKMSLNKNGVSARKRIVNEFDLSFREKRLFNIIISAIRTDS
ncbi:glycosyltransferase family 4 protein [Methanohalophilus sp. DAL1]|uniref:glycosyltransferase family 4 protein n=1 Tax=Methanohalophilus sp. DAL1 TaxID=1864608 RepID=UPI000FA2F5CA|nr:glycosyltransferase family 4 protein [Methanohalophilus sp. DAL1]RSD35140.1 MAG: glycosyl transferase, group 1 [Methanohalophilus sp.]